ncbi:basic salivary proline-rich protein 1-like isoform X2 [Trachemys scripta elegans]|uniref:basic salivary proline-rich protein 1-like isoform X2 n=1 Tax=Trachemys scripta elegans TaxID=31138 RepID=UPI0015554FAC|nr:basic salivary proline-rich protein 1-like isoform X2 [Trachemys scripta elegans]
MAALPWSPARPGLARLWLEAAPVCALRAPGRGARPACSTEGVAFLDYPCPLPSLQARLVQYSLTLHSSVMQERALLKHPRPRRSRSVGGRPTAARRGPHVLDKALPMPKGHLQPRSMITASSRNKSGSPTPELPGASVGPEHSQAGGGATLEPRGDRNHLDTAPPSGSSLNTRATGGQHSAPMLPPTDALPQASATPGGVNGPAAPPPPHHPKCRRALGAWHARVPTLGPRGEPCRRGRPHRPTCPRPARRKRPGPPAP